MISRPFSFTREYLCNDGKKELRFLCPSNNKNKMKKEKKNEKIISFSHTGNNLMDDAQSIRIRYPRELERNRLVRDASCPLVRYNIARNATNNNNNNYKCDSAFLKAYRDNNPNVNSTLYPYGHYSFMHVCVIMRGCVSLDLGILAPLIVSMMSSFEKRKKTEKRRSKLMWFRV